MREFTKSVISFAWSSSLLGLQEMAKFLTPQGWLQTGQSARSFNSVTKATTEQMGSIAQSSFRVGDNLQRGTVDLMFSLFTLGLLNGSSCGDSRSSARNVSGPGGVSNAGGQAVNFVSQTLGALGQTAGIVGQAMGGAMPGTGCGSCSSAETGWGPVRPPDQR
jgi:hypothetical protein